MENSQLCVFFQNLDKQHTGWYNRTALKRGMAYSSLCYKKLLFSFILNLNKLSESRHKSALLLST